MKKFTKGVIIGSVAVGSILSASMAMQDRGARNRVMKNTKKAYRKAEDLLNM